MTITIEQTGPYTWRATGPDATVWESNSPTALKIRLRFAYGPFRAFTRTMKGAQS